MRTVWRNRQELSYHLPKSEENEFDILPPQASNRNWEWINVWFSPLDYNSTKPCLASAAARDCRTYHVKRKFFPYYLRLFSNHTIPHLLSSSDHPFLYSVGQVLKMRSLRLLHCNPHPRVYTQVHHHLHLQIKGHLMLEASIYKRQTDAA